MAQEESGESLKVEMMAGCADCGVVEVVNFDRMRGEGRREEERKGRWKGRFYDEGKQRGQTTGRHEVVRLDEIRELQDRLFSLWVWALCLLSS